MKGINQLVDTIQKVDDFIVWVKETHPEIIKEYLKLGNGKW